MKEFEKKGNLISKCYFYIISVLSYLVSIVYTVVMAVVFVPHISTTQESADSIIRISESGWFKFIASFPVINFWLAVAFIVPFLVLILLRKIRFSNYKRNFILFVIQVLLFIISVAVLLVYAGFILGQIQ